MEQLTGIRNPWSRAAVRGVGLLAVLALAACSGPTATSPTSMAPDNSRNSPVTPPASPPATPATSAATPPAPSPAGTPTPGGDAVDPTPAGKGWRQVLSTDFSGKSLPQPWGHRNTASYQAGGRQCSAPYEGNVKLADGNVLLSMTTETSAANIGRAKAAGCRKGEYYRNAMISTQGRFTVRTGMLAARVKFPEGQGMHGSVWLQSVARSEIDMIESYGYGAGLTSVIHVDGTRYPLKGPYVAGQAVRDREWWQRYHVFSVEWDRDQVLFRIDGVETQRVRKRTPNADYFVVISLLSSDWELKRLRRPLQRADGVGPTTLPETMAVDWVRVWARS